MTILDNLYINNFYERIYFVMSNTYFINPHDFNEDDLKKAVFNAALNYVLANVDNPDFCEYLLLQEEPDKTTLFDASVYHIASQGLFAKNKLLLPDNYELTTPVDSYEYKFKVISDYPNDWYICELICCEDDPELAGLYRVIGINPIYDIDALKYEWAVPTFAWAAYAAFHMHYLADVAPLLIKLDANLIIKLQSSYIDVGKYRVPCERNWLANIELLNKELDLIKDNPEKYIKEHNGYRKFIH